RNVVMSIEETQRVIAELEGPPRDENGLLLGPSPNWSLIIRLAIYTGMRQGEILGLQWHDLHATNSAIHRHPRLERRRVRPSEDGERNSVGRGPARADA